jgi:MFS-type transporter involved in bile tolerance (Atg22 family)
MVETNITDQEYRRRIRSWTLYDWANSAFATTILAAVLPIYYSQVAAATLASPARATAFWSAGLSASLLLVAASAPILGTVSDIMRGKKRFLALFTGIGVLATGLLVLVERGDWLLASLLFVFGRIGFSGAYTFYDALLPHVARLEDQDRVSSRGYAIGYLGGGVLLAVNVVMIRLLPGTWGPRLSFLSVAVWWALFSLPLFLRVPEPLTSTAALAPGQSVVGVSFRRLVDTLRHVRRYRELFKYLLAYLIYIDAVGTIISLAAIYGAELGLGSTEMILALLLVQFMGIPYSLIFGRLPGSGLPGRNARHRPFFLGFILFNTAALPALGIIGAARLPADISLGVIIGLIAALEAVGLALAFLLGPRLLAGMASRMTTQNSILLALVMYTVIAVWGFFLHTTLEFWCLAWMVACVQGGSQALSRSLYASMVPAAKSGEFFGLFSVMEKFASILGPLVFVAAGAIFNTSRPAVLSLIVFFALGGWLLMRVDVEAGRKLARQEESQEGADG